MSLIEGMTASVVFLVGLVGVLQGLVVASQQNSMAGRMARASSIANQAHEGMYQLGRARLLSASAPIGLLNSSRCSAALATYAGKSATITPTPCFVDLDAYDTAAAAAVKVVPGYPTEDASKYRRVLVYVNTDPRVETVGVVVSWMDGGVRRFHQQFGGFYNPALNGAGLDNNL